MRKTSIFIFALLFLFLTNVDCYGQTPVKISKPRLELKDNNINIFYNILNSSQTDKFKIWIEITDSIGNKIDTQSLIGDIGDNVSGGSNKKIIWDITADSIYLDVGIYIQVNAEVQTPTETVEISKPVKKISRGGSIIRSIVFPGWGLSMINKGKPHWLKGLTGYGCIVASVIYNKKAISSYDDYLNTYNLPEIDEFYNNSVKEDNLSEIFGYTAMGIWLIDFIWTVVGSSKHINDTGNNQVSGFSINTEFNQQAHAPTIVFRYNF